MRREGPEVVDRCDQPVVRARPWAPSPGSARAMVISGWRTLGSSVGQGLCSIGAALPVISEHQLGQLEHGELGGVADVGRVDPVALEEPVDPVDQVGDVAEGAGLVALAVDGERLAPERLDHEVRHHPAVLRPHPGPVGVEDPDDPGVDAVVAVVGHGDRLGEPLGLVVDAARADRVDVAPVALRLGVDLGVAVDLGGRRQEEPGVLGLGQAQGVVGAERADLEGLDRELEVVDRAGRGGEVQHAVERPVDVDVAW